MKNARRIAAMVLAGAMAFTMLTPQTALAAKKKKVTYVTRAYALKQIENKLGATVQTEDMSAVTDKKVSKSDQKTMAVAVNAGLVTPNSKGKLSPKTKATYGYVAGVLAKVEEKSSKTVLGKNKSSKKLTRTTLNSYLKKQLKNVVKKPGTVISNKTYNGDLIIGDGVGTGEVTLDNVDVKGKLIVRGGGENSIIIRGKSKITSIAIKQVNNKVSIKVRDAADISMVYIQDGSNDVNFEGNVGELTVNGADINVNLKGATVEKLTVADTAKRSTINADKDSSVKEVSIDAEGAKASGDGKIDSLKVNANDVTLAITDKDTKVDVKEGVSAPKTEDQSAANNGNTAPAGGGAAPVPSGGGAAPAGGSTGGSTGGSGNNSGSGSGSGSGSSSESGSGSSSGETKDEDLYETDSRFATGYPQVETTKDSTEHGNYTNVKITYKLNPGVATTGSAVRVYYVISGVNTNWNTNTESVLHGHAGITNNERHDMINVDEYGFVDIDDNEEHSETIRMNGTRDGLVLYSVIDDGKGNISAKPDRVLFTKDTAEGFVDRRVNLSTTYINAAGDKLYTYVYSRLDDTSVPDATDFYLTNSNDISATLPNITGVRIRKDLTWPTTNLLIFELSDKLDYTSGLRLNYDPKRENVDSKPLQDESGNKADAGASSISQADTTVFAAYRSKDNKNVRVSVPINFAAPSEYGNSQTLDIYVNGDKIDRSQSTWSASVDDADINIWGLSGDPITSVEFRSNDSTRPLVNAAFDTLSDLKATEFTEDKDISVKSATYNGSSLEITLNDDNDYSYTRSSFYACNIEINVDGKIYRGRGNVGSRYEDGRIRSLVLTKQIEHIDFSGATSVNVRYSPIIPTNTRNIYRYDYFTYPSGALVPASTDWTPVTISK